MDELNDHALFLDNDTPPGGAVTGKLAAGLRKLGFDAVFDTNFGADLTIIEEAKEVREQEQNSGCVRQC